MPFPKVCKGCQQPFTADRRAREFHSRRCFAQWRERQPWWQAGKRRGQLKVAAGQREKSLRRYALKAEQCETKGQAYREGVREGYRLGWKRGARVGYANGYEDALKATAAARAMARTA